MAISNCKSASQNKKDPFWYNLVSGYSGKNKDTIIKGINKITGREIEYKIEGKTLMIFATASEIDTICKSGIVVDNLYGKSSNKAYKSAAATVYHQGV